MFYTDLVMFKILQIKLYESSFKCNWNYSIMILIYGDMPFTREKGQAGAEFLRTNDGLVGFELLMHPP